MAAYRYFRNDQLKEDPTTGTKCRTGQLNHQFVEQKFVGGVWVGIGDNDGVRYGDVAGAGCRFREGMRDGDYVVDVEIEVGGFLLAEGDGWVNCGSVEGYWTPQNKTEVKLWLDGSDLSGLFTDTNMTTNVISDGDAVALWKDKSGNGNHAIQSVSNTRPVYKVNIKNNKSLIRFTPALSHTLLIASGNTIPVNAPLTVFTLIKLNNYSTLGARKILAFKGGSGALGWAFSAGINSMNGRFTKLGVADMMCAFPSIDNHNYLLLTGKFDSTFGLTFYDNGKLRSLVTSASDTLPGSRDFIIGGGINTNEYWDGDIAEIIVSNKEYSDLEVFNISQYFIAKWGIKKPVLNASNYLNTPTSDGSGQAVHPSVIYEVNGWNGFKYWMAMTPFPNADSTKENPEILCSNDGDVWIVPVGLTNPITPAPQSGYNSDTELILVSNTLWCVWRETLTSNYDKIYLSSSVDGVTWSAKQLVLTTAYGGCLSPTIIYNGSNFVLYFVDQTSTDPVIKYATCATINGTYTVVGAIAITDPWTSTAYWHLCVRKNGEVYTMILQLIGKYNLLLTSSDGVNWSMDVNFKLDPTLSAWDSTEMYRSTFVDMGSYLDIWYSARKGTSPQVWHIGRTKY